MTFSVFYIPCTNYSYNVHKWRRICGNDIVVYSLRSCISLADIRECPDEDSDAIVDCTRWNAASALPILDLTSNTLFPNINSTSCVSALKNLLDASYNTKETFDSDEDAEECFTNCTATLVDECAVSVLLLENVNARSISNLTLYGTHEPHECGIYNVTCCKQSFPERCLGKNQGPKEN